MRRILGLDHLLNKQVTGYVEYSHMFLAELANATMKIQGIRETVPITVAELKLLDDGLFYDRYSQRIDLLFVGRILHAEVPLSYAIQGESIVVTGRCSTIKQVCGVDLLLNESYTGCMGDIIRQKFSLAINNL
ncbi:MAG: hypothetical protein WC782_01185 [Methylococcaceae bacterium]|jgi:hypothetical protein